MNLSDPSPSSQFSNAPSDPHQGSAPPPVPPPVSRPAPPLHVQTAAGARRVSPSASRLPRRLRSVQDVQTVAASQNPACVPLLIHALGSRDETLKREAKRVLPQFGEAAMIGLLRAAAHAGGQTREEAVGCLGEWGDVRAFQPLLLALKNERRERTVRTTFQYLGLFITSFVAAMFTRNYYGDWLPSARDDMGLPVIQIQAETGLRVRACAALARLGDVRAIVPLIELGRCSDGEVRWAARNALTQLLPIAAQLPTAQARMLGPEGIPALLSLIFDADEPFACLALRALGAVGDQRALPGVQRLAGDLTRPYARQEAAALLPVLQARCQQEQARSTLLRGASAPHTRSGDVLLRAAQATPEAHPAELLRGADYTPPGMQNTVPNLNGDESAG